jgi:hypothetical protein
MSTRVRFLTAVVAMVLSLAASLFGVSPSQAQDGGGAHILHTCTEGGVFIAADGSYFDAVAAPCRQVLSSGRNFQETDQTWQPTSVPNPSKTVMFNYANTGLVCYLGNTGISTTDWVEYVTPSGHVTMVCRVNPRKTTSHTTPSTSQTQSTNSAQQPSNPNNHKGGNGNGNSGNGNSGNGNSGNGNSGNGNSGNGHKKG